MDEAAWSWLEARSGEGEEASWSPIGGPNGTVVEFLPSNLRKPAAETRPALFVFQPPLAETYSQSMSAGLTNLLGLDLNLDLDHGRNLDLFQNFKVQGPHESRPTSSHDTRVIASTAALCSFGFDLHPGALQ